VSVHKTGFEQRCGWGAPRIESLAHRAFAVTVHKIGIRLSFWLYREPYGSRTIAEEADLGYAATAPPRMPLCRNCGDLTERFWI
jgi:hypothetical protein